MSKILCDTNILIFSAQNKLPEKAKAYLSDEGNILYYSAAAIRELSIKVAAGKLANISPLQMKEALDTAGYRELPIKSEHTLQTSSLRDIHKDPFDRIMVAQAICEGMILLTTDATLTAYSDFVILC